MAECIAALQQAAAVAPVPLRSISACRRRTPTAQQPSAALKAVEGALALEPKSTEYLRARAMLATWLADYGRAQQSYRQLAALLPGDAEIALAYARVSAWGGDTDEAVTQYERYLTPIPKLQTPGSSSHKAESWRGNYGGAMRALDAYRARFGESMAYAQTYAAVMAGGGRPARAEDVVAPLLAQTPDDLQLNLTHTIALAMQRRPREAYSSLDTVRQLAPASRDTQNAERVVRTMLASSVEPTFTAYSDSDQLQVQRFTPRGTFALKSGTHISAGYDRALLTARAGSGLEQVDGSNSADYEQHMGRTGAEIRRVHCGCAGRICQARHAARRHLRRRHDRSSKRQPVVFGGAEFRRPCDLAEDGRTGPHTDRSSRAGAVGARRWSRWWCSTVSIQEFSDGNRRVELTLSPRRSFARTAGFNLDLGVSAYRLETELRSRQRLLRPEAVRALRVHRVSVFQVQRKRRPVDVRPRCGAQRDCHLTVVPIRRNRER